MKIILFYIFLLSLCVLVSTNKLKQNPQAPAPTAADNKNASKVDLSKAYNKPDETLQFSVYDPKAKYGEGLKKEELEITKNFII